MKIFITLLLLLILGLSLSLEVDEIANRLQDESFNRALVSFALAKGLNAVISLLQGTELSFTPVGVGLNFSVGEILDPFNDMVERFSWVMLLASVSLGVQKILLTLSATLFMQIALGLSALFSLFLVWSKSIKLHAFTPFVFKSFFLLLLLRFSAVVFISFVSLLHTNVLSLEYKEASAVVSKTKAELDNLSKQKQNLAKVQEEDGFFSGISSKYDAVFENLNISQDLQNLQETIEQASQNIVTLITIFVLETVLMPLLYFWLLILSIKYLFRFEFDTFIKKLLYNKVN